MYISLLYNFYLSTKKFRYTCFKISLKRNLSLNIGYFKCFIYSKIHSLNWFHFDQFLLVYFGNLLSGMSYIWDCYTFLEKWPLLNHAVSWSHRQETGGLVHRVAHNWVTEHAQVSYFILGNVPHSEVYFDINTATPPFFWLMSIWYTFSNILLLNCFFNLKWISCRKHIILLFSPNLHYHS